MNIVCFQWVTGSGEVTNVTLQGKIHSEFRVFDKFMVNLAHIQY